MSDKAVGLVKNYAQLLGVAGVLVLTGSIYQEHRSSVHDIAHIKRVLDDNSQRLVRIETQLRIDSSKTAAHSKQ